jgi:integrase
MRMRLTKRIVEAAAYQGEAGARCVLWDEEVRGFGLRITPAGHKSYLVSYRIKGRKRQMGIGAASVLSVDAARARARRHLVAVEDGKDPLAIRVQERIEAQTGAVSAMIEAYIEARKMRRPDLAKWFLDKHIAPKLGTRVWRDVKRSEVQAWYSSVTGAGNANRALNVLRAAFTWRLLQEDSSPATAGDLRNPCVGIVKRAEKARQVRLELADLPKLEAAISLEPNPYLRGLFRFMLATGCRKGEALGLRWEQVRLQEPSSVQFLDTKNGHDRTTPLTAGGVELLKALPRIVGNPFVFAGEGRAAIRNPQKAWARARKRADLNHITLHDLRRSVGSWLGESGFSSKQIGNLLGHRSDITSKVYIALGDASSRAAVDALEKLKNPRTDKQAGAAA